MGTQFSPKLSENIVLYRLHVKIFNAEIMKKTLHLPIMDSFESDWVDQRPDLDSSAVVTDMRLQLAARQCLESSNSSLAEFNLEWWEYDVLSSLRRVGPPYESPVNGINDILPITSGALTNRLNRLMERQLITRRHDTNDRRKVLVSLSTKGLNLINVAVSARFDAANTATSTLNKREQKQLDKLLNKLIKA